MKPRREGQRPLLPQHARHCPVLEAGSALGVMVYPPLELTESYVIEFQGEGKYQFTYFISGGGGHWEPVFALAMSLPLGGVGMIKEDVTFLTRKSPMSATDSAAGSIRQPGWSPSTSMRLACRMAAGPKRAPLRLVTPMS